MLTRLMAERKRGILSLKWLKGDCVINVSRTVIGKLPEKTVFGDERTDVYTFVLPPSGLQGLSAFHAPSHTCGEKWQPEEKLPKEALTVGGVPCSWHLEPNAWSCSGKSVAAEAFQQELKDKRTDSLLISHLDKMSSHSWTVVEEPLASLAVWLAS